MGISDYKQTRLRFTFYWVSYWGMTLLQRGQLWETQKYGEKIDRVNFQPAFDPF